MTERNSTRASILNQLKNKPTGYRYSTDEYILLASDAHKYRYTYEKTEYKTAQEFITVTCPEHGDFTVRANRHLRNNRGCPTCFPDRRGGNRKRITTSEFIAKATEKHKGFYSYEKSIYEYSTKKVTVTCPKHGDFEVRATNHLRGDGCGKCALEAMPATRNIGLDGFIDRARKKHGSKYDYSKSTYIDSVTEIEIVCPDHGSFFRTPNNHISGGYGCNECAGRIEFTLQDFLNQAKEAHGNKFNYKKVQYRNKTTKVEIVCKTHGSFWQTPSGHLRPNGCPECAKESAGWSRSDFIDKCLNNNNGKGTLYVIQCRKKNEVFYKVGVTSHSVTWRFKSKRNMPYKYKTLFEIVAEGGYIYDLEVTLHSLLKDNRHNPLMDFGGKTECFSTIKPIESLLKELTTTEQMQLIA